MSTLFVHLGYPKTATTTFQQHVFPNLPDLVYLGKLIPSFRYIDPAIYPLINELMVADSVSYGGVAALRDALAPHRVAAAGRPLLISSESFLHVSATDPGVVAARVQAAFDPCKVIITIREQRSLLRSFYGLHGRFGQYLFVTKPELEALPLPLSIDRWLDLCFRSPFRNLPALLHYDLIIDHYRRLLGSGNVGVFLFEELRREPQSFNRRLAEFLGLDPGVMTGVQQGRHEHSGITRGELLWWRLSRRLGRQTQGDTIERRITSPLARWLSRGSPVTDAIPAHWEARLAGLYGPGNRRLVDLLGLPLGEFGYAGW